MQQMLRGLEAAKNGPARHVGLRCEARQARPVRGPSAAREESETHRGRVFSTPHARPRQVWSPAAGRGAALQVRRYRALQVPRQRTARPKGGTPAGAALPNARVGGRAARNHFRLEEEFL